MIFEYTVVGPDGKEQLGKIEAASEVEARKKLNEMGLSVLRVSEITSSSVSKSNLKKFLFAGKDNENQEVEGEIEAKDELFAYKRLIEEFNLELSWLVDAQAPKAVQEAKKKGSIQFLENLALERGVEVRKKIQKKEENLASEAIDNEDFRLKQQKIIEKVNRVLLLVEPFYKFIQTKSPVVGLEIEKKINNLAKIKMSNNLLYIEESTDEIINDILQFFDRYKNERASFQKELLELESLLTNATKAKTQKALHDLTQVFARSLTTFKSLFHLRPQEETSDDENILLLKQLESDRREILRLLFYHFWGALVKVGELRKKHREAFVKLLKKYKSISNSIRQVRLLLKKVREFHTKDLGFIIDEIEYFASWLLGLYILFFVIAEISLVKSKVLPIDFIWDVMKSGLIISISFGLFLILLLSPWLKRYGSKNLVTMLGGYVFTLSVAVLFYFNF